MSPSATEPPRRVRLAGALMTAGMLAVAVVSAFHPAAEDPNDHRAVFAEYARDDSWTALHLGQFAAGLIVLAGLVVLHRALVATGPAGALASAALAGVGATAVALAILQAIDGVALKHAVDAWAAAPAPRRDGAFADAEIVRWIEWGANSTLRLLEGLTVALFGLAALRAGLAARWLGRVAVAAGAAYAATGVEVALHGFTLTSLTFATAGDLAFLVFALGLLVTGTRAVAASPLRIPQGGPA